MRKIFWLIDDDDAAHTYHRVMIEEAGYELNGVSSFYSVDEAIQQLLANNGASGKTKWPDYILLDINMPVKTGYTFMDEFDLIPTQHPTPDIYFVSSSKNPFDIQRAKEIENIKGFEAKFLEQEFFERLKQ